MPWLYISIAETLDSQSMHLRLSAR